MVFRNVSTVNMDAEKPGVSATNFCIFIFIFFYIDVFSKICFPLSVVIFGPKYPPIGCNFGPTFF